MDEMTQKRRDNYSYRYCILVLSIFVAVCITSTQSTGTTETYTLQITNQGKSTGNSTSSTNTTQGYLSLVMDKQPPIYNETKQTTESQHENVTNPNQTVFDSNVTIYEVMISLLHQIESSAIQNITTSHNQTISGSNVTSSKIMSRYSTATNVTGINKSSSHNLTIIVTNVTTNQVIKSTSLKQLSTTGTNTTGRNLTETNTRINGSYVTRELYPTQTNTKGKNTTSENELVKGINITEVNIIRTGCENETNVTEKNSVSHNKTATGINITNDYTEYTGYQNQTNAIGINVTSQVHVVTVRSFPDISTPDVSTPEPDQIRSVISVNTQLEVQDSNGTSTKSYKPESIPSTYPDKETKCTSAACKIVSSRILSLMNHSTDPCDGFYEFACGGLIENRNLLQHVPEHETWSRISDALMKVNGQSPEAYKKFKTFYEQCVNYDSIVNKTTRLQEARNVLDSVGKLYTLSEWISGRHTLNLTALLVKLLSLDSASIFDVQLDVNDDDVTKFSLKLMPPTQHSKFVLESRRLEQCKKNIKSYNKTNNLKDIYIDKYIQCTMDYEDYMNTTQKALQEFGIFKELDDFEWRQNVLMLRRFIELIINYLQELPEPGVMNLILSARGYDIMTIDNLQKSFTQVDWTALFQALLHQTITPDTKVQLYFMNYFDKFFEEFGFVNNEIYNMNMHNALLAMFAHDLYVDLVETRSACDRENYCLKVTSGLLEEVSSSLYLSSFTKNELHGMQNELNTLFKRLKIILEEEFVTATWLDDSSRSNLLNKLQKMVSVTDGGNVFYGDTNMLNRILTAVDVTTSNSYLDNAVALVRRYREKMYLFYPEKTNSKETIWSYHLLPYATEAVTLYPLNTVVIPFGLMGSPQTKPDLPTYIYKTRIGNALARQIAHHFDTTGIQYGTSGKDYNMLSFRTKQNYDNWGDCDGNLLGFSMAWKNIKGQTFSFEIDDRLAKNGRFADSAALLLTYRALKDVAEREPILPWLDMNYDKLYYLLVTQELCTKGDILDHTIQLYESVQMPPLLRTFTMIKNSEDFANVYRCKPGQRMYPPVKCDTFPHFMINDYDYETDGLPEAA